MSNEKGKQSQNLEQAQSCKPDVDEEYKRIACGKEKQSLCQMGEWTIKGYRIVQMKITINQKIDIFTEFHSLENQSSNESLKHCPMSIQASSEL